LIVGEFSQHFVDQLDMTVTPIEYLHRNFPDLDQQYIRRMLGRFGLTGKTHLQKIISLSGGQKSRVVFADICMRHPHLLFLDEPTNHLDIESIDALAQALNVFKGGIILVSHDGRLISEVCTNVWVTGNETVTIYDGNFDEYRTDLVTEFEERERQLEEERLKKEKQKKIQREQDRTEREAKKLAKQQAKQ